MVVKRVQSDVLEEGLDMECVYVWRGWVGVGVVCVCEGGGV